MEAVIKGPSLRPIHCKELSYWLGFNKLYSSTKGHLFLEAALCCEL
jgi:hypothetical protein